MALHGDISVNGKSIGGWAAVRVSHTEQVPNPMDIVTYTCEVSIEQTLQGNPPVVWKGQVTHRFGDGALALAARVLSVAATETHVQL